MTPKTISKRDGKIVPFDAAKIRDAITGAANDVPAGEKPMTENDITFVTGKVIEQLNPRKRPVTVESVQDLVELTLIEYGFAATAKAYIVYRAEHARRRDIQGALMDIYKTLTFSPAKASDMKRENANVNGDSSMGTMLKYGAEGAKYFCNKMILPPEIAEAHIGGDIHIHDQDFYLLTETCCQIDPIPLFKNGFSTGHGFLRPPSNILSRAALLCIIIQANQNEMHGGQSIPNFDYAMAEGVRQSFCRYLKEELISYYLYKQNFNQEAAKAKAEERLAEFQGEIRLSALDLLRPLYGKEIVEEALRKTERDTYQAMEALIHNLNTMHSRAGAQVPFSSINYGTDTSPEGRIVIRNLLLATDAGLGSGETAIFPVQIFKLRAGVNYNPEDTNYDLFKLAMKVSAKRLFPNFSNLDAPFNAQYYKKGDYNTEVAYMGCVDKDEVISYTINSDLYVESIGRLYEKAEKNHFELRRYGESNYFDLEKYDIKVYDSHSKKFVKVKKVIRNPHKEKNWKKVTFAEGRDLLATVDHPLPVNGEIRTRVDNLQKNDTIPLCLLQPIAKEEASSFSLDELWLMGCTLAQEKDSVIRVDRDNTILIDRVSRLLGDKGLEKGASREFLLGVEREDTYSNLFVEGSTTKHIPSFVFRSPRSERLAFLSGILDCAGYYIDTKKTRIKLIAEKREIALQLVALIQSVGMVAAVAANEVLFEVSEELKKLVFCQCKEESGCSFALSEIGTVQSVVDSDYVGESYDLETESGRFDISGIQSFNCRTRVMGNVYDKTREITCGRGNLSFTSINLPRIAILSEKNLKTFYTKLDAMLDLVIRQLLHRMEIQKARRVRNYPFLMGEGVWIDSKKLNWDESVGEILHHGTLTVGFIGLAEALKSLIGKHHGESEEAQQLGLEIIGHIRQRLDQESQLRHLNFTLIATPAESLSGRFVMLDRKRFGVIPGITDKEYYTNSFHVPVYYPIKAYKKIDIEAPYHNLTNAGHITYVELDGDTARNIDAFETIIRYMHDKGIGYGSINHPLDRDPLCGYVGVIGDTCPRCGRKDGEGIAPERLEELRRRFPCLCH